MLERRQEPVNPWATTIPSEGGPGSWWALIGTPSVVVRVVVIAAFEFIASIIARLCCAGCVSGTTSTVLYPFLVGSGIGCGIAVLPIRPQRTPDTPERWQLYVISC